MPLGQRVCCSSCLELQPYPRYLCLASTHPLKCFSMSSLWEVFLRHHFQVQVSVAPWLCYVFLSLSHLACRPLWSQDLFVHSVHIGDTQHCYFNKQIKEWHPGIHHQWHPWPHQGQGWEREWSPKNGLVTMTLLELNRQSGVAVQRQLPEQWWWRPVFSYEVPQNSIGRGPLRHLNMTLPQRCFQSGTNRSSSWPVFCYQIQDSIQKTMGIVTMVWGLDVKKQCVGSGTILSQSSCHAWHRAHNSWQSKPHIWENHSSNYIIIIIKPKIKITQTINGQSSVGGGVDFLWLKCFHCEMKGIGIKWKPWTLPTRLGHQRAVGISSFTIWYVSL